MDVHRHSGCNDPLLQSAKSHQRYFSNWIEEAKTPATRDDRIAKAIRGLAMGLNFGEMIRFFKKQS